MESFISVALLSSVICILSTITLGALRPRGVSMPIKVFYDPSQLFRCLDGSGAFPFHFVNDDFCDCPDGSDEPGTSACGNGIFSCLNHGHLSVSLPSSRVNDGICDCCDSSDEYRSSADCFNNCKELGAQALAAAKQVQEKFLKGQEIRNEYIRLGTEKKNEYKILLEDLLKQEQKALDAKNEKQDQKFDAESRESIILQQEKEFLKAQQKRIDIEKHLLIEQQIQESVEGQKCFTQLDTNNDGKITIDEIKAFDRFDYDGDGEVSDNEAQFYLQKKEEMTLEDFMTSGWRVMKSAFTIEEIDTPPDIITIKDEEYKEPIETPPVIDKIVKENVIKDATIARKDFANADKLFRDIQAEIWHLKRKIESDFGKEDEFLVLENQCFEYTERKYLYRLCPFDKVVQMLRVNKEETLIGLWNDWGGVGDAQYDQMQYTRGASCWNGPDRSAVVFLKCGTDNKVVSVEESSPCSYKLEFTTPASCLDLPADVMKVLKTETAF